MGQTTLPPLHLIEQLACNGLEWLHAIVSAAEHHSPFRRGYQQRGEPDDCSCVNPPRCSSLESRSRQLRNIAAACASKSAESAATVTACTAQPASHCE